MPPPKKIKFINSKNLIEMINSLLVQNVNFSYFIHGKAGIGKTEIISNLAVKNGYKLLILNLAHMEEGDLIGIPYRDGESMKYSIPEWLHENRNEKILLFLDELDRAPKNILNTVLSIIREYRIHTHFLPNNWKIIAAGNSGINDAFYDTNEMDFALKSRFIHIFYELTALEWLEWAEKNKIHPLITAYIKTKPGELIYEPETNDVFSYPNPRTWEILSKALYVTPQNLWKYIIEGAIGEGIGSIFYIFTRTFDKNSLPISFSEFVVDPKKTFQTFKNASKETIIDTVTNISNNIETIIKENKQSVVVETFAKIIGVLIFLEYFEFSALLFNAIETVENGSKFNNAILNYMKNDKKLYELLQEHRNKISFLSKNNI